jgi:hypothetical protein
MRKMTSTHFVFISSALAIFAGIAGFIGTVIKHREDVASKVATSVAAHAAENRTIEAMAAINRWREAQAAITAATASLSVAVLSEAKNNFASADKRLTEVAENASEETVAEINRRAKISEAQVSAINEAARLNDGYREKLLAAVAIVREYIEQYPKTLFNPTLSPLAFPNRIVGTSYEQMITHTQGSSAIVMTVTFTPRMSWRFQLSFGRIKSPREMMTDLPPFGNETFEPKIEIQENKTESDRQTLIPTYRQIGIIQVKGESAMLFVTDPEGIPAGRLAAVNKEFSGNEKIANLTIEMVNACRIRAVELN